ncbi:MAG: sulfatase-like hydrolase/transferase, partial [Candidatus Margulisbacteria bacterium]|nr:sulfatase-like hydrolase/transferase [Candidatus Margulisiibacteriota bacterium]
DKRHLYKTPSHPKEAYANSIHLADQGLHVFFEELRKRPHFKNSIVIIAGDHSLPMGDHGTYHLEVGYHDDSFRTPLIIHWDGVLKPQVLDTVHSQMDIVPTILDLLNTPPLPNNFQGRSIFDPDSRDRIIPMVQPYGKYIGLYKAPYKYIYHGNSGMVYAYNLDTDPEERHNIYKTLSDPILKEFKDALDQVYLNDYLIKNNLIWP